MEPPRRALAVVAHPDDCDFRAGGTVRKWSEAGARVSLAVLTDGSKGSHEPAQPGDDLASRRAREQRAAARVLGIEDVFFLGAIDGELEPTDALMFRVAVLIRHLCPEIVITHDPWRRHMFHPDHVAAGTIAHRAAFRAREPRFLPELALCGLPAWRLRELWLFAADAPDHVEDTTETFDAKLEAILCHESQYSSSMGFEPGDAAGATAFADRLRARFAEIGARGGYALGEDYKRIVLGD